jgi:hypothetical protein
MLNENMSEAIRAGLIQYIGAILSNCGKQGSEAAHVALAQLSEAWLSCCQKEKGGYDMFAAKPILRATSLLLKSRLTEAIESVKQFGQSPEEIPAVKNYRIAIEVLDKIVETTKESESK